MQTQSKHKQDASGAEPRVTFWILTQFCLLKIPVPGPCSGNACKAFVPPAAIHSAHFLAEHGALGTCEILPTDSMEPTLLIELSSSIETKKQCWLRCSFLQRADSKMQIQPAFLGSILSSKDDTAAEGVLTQKIKFKS